MSFLPDLDLSFFLALIVIALSYRWLERWWQSGRGGWIRMPVAYASAALALLVLLGWLAKLFGTAVQKLP